MSDSTNPTDRRYIDTHEWHRPDGELVTVGITRHAIDELTDITYVDLPPVGTQVGPDEAAGEIESVKATSELYCGIAGEVVEVNDAVVADPAAVNRDPWNEGWLFKVKPADAAALEGLMDAAAYTQKFGG